MSLPSKITIRAPGPLGHGTKVIATESGAEMHGVRAIRIEIAPDAMIVATCELIFVEADLNAKARWSVRDPETGQLREIASIVWADAGETDVD